jgi:hypothetical protein
MAALHALRVELLVVDAISSDKRVMYGMSILIVRSRKASMNSLFKQARYSASLVCR